MGQLVVGELRINMRANTASLVTDMQGASDTAKKTSKQMQDSFNSLDMTEARGGIMVLGEEIGVHLPRHVQAFVATLPGVGAAMAAAFPLLAVVAIGKAVFEVVEKFQKMGEEAKQAGLDQVSLGTSINKTFDSMDEKLLRAGITTDDLAGNHLAALRKQLELINKQSMSELVSSFDVIAKAADKVFADLKAHWYSFGIGSEGAKNALTTFQTQYESLLAQGKNKAASDLLAGTLDSARKVLAFQKQYAANQLDAATGKGPNGAVADYQKFEEASLALKKAGVGVTELETKSQQALVDTLQAQLTVQAKIAALKAVESGNAIQEEKNKSVFTVNAKSKLGMQGSIGSRGEYVNPEDTKARADAAQDLVIANDLAKAHEYDLGVEAKVTNEISKQSKVWSELAALTEKDNLAADEHKIRLQEASGVLTKIQADQQIAALYAAAELKDQQQKNIELAKQAALVKQLGDLTKNGTSGAELDKAAYAKALADYQQFLIAKERAKAASDQKIFTAEQAEAARLFAIQKKAIDGITNLLNSGVQSWIAGQQTFGQAAQQVFQNFADSAIMGLVKVGEERLVQHILGKSLDDEDKLSDASGAARKVFKSVMSALPFPANVIAAPLAAAGVFAAAMAFEKGGEVPGFGNQGVNAVLHPREMVLDSSLADVVRNAAANNGGGRNGAAQHVHYSPHVSVPPGGEAAFAKILDSNFDRWSRSQARRRYVNTSGF
jgi:hypothetical protein